MCRLLYLNQFSEIVHVSRFPPKPIADSLACRLKDRCHICCAKLARAALSWGGEFRRTFWMLVERSLRDGNESTIVVPRPILPSRKICPGQTFFRQQLKPA